MRFEIEDGVLTSYDGVEEHVVIPDSVIRIDDNVFEGHTEIRTVVFPEGLQEIGDSAFTGCTALESIELPDSVTLIDSLAFYECHALQSVRLPRGLEEINDQVFMETDISTIELPEGLRYIGDGAFAGCKKLKSVHIPDSVEKIDVLAFGYMSNWDTDSEKIEGFELHGRLNGPARSYAHEYELVFVPDDGDLSDLPEFEIRNGVLECYNGSAETVVIPDTVRQIGEYAFKANKTMKHVVIPDTVNEIGFHSFEDCTALEEADIPGSVRVIVAYAFMRCYALKNVTLHEGLMEIGTWAFGDCKNLKDISIPASVRKIAHYALGFEESSYEDIYVHGIPHRYAYGLRIHTNGNDAAHTYIAWHKLGMKMLRLFNENEREQE